MEGSVAGRLPGGVVIPLPQGVRPQTPGGAGARTGVVAASQTPRRGAASSPEMSRTVESHWQRLTRRDHIQIASALQTAMADGLTYDEFVEVTGYDVLTEEAWRAMVGGETVASLADLDYYLTVFENWSSLSGVSFDEFARSKRITIVHDRELLAHMMTMSQDGLRNLIRSLDRTQVANFLQHMIPGMPGLPTNLIGMAPARIEDMLVRALQRLQSTARHGSPMGQPQARHALSLLGSASLQRLGRYAEHDGISRGLGDPQFHLNGQSYDPLVARHLLAGWVGAQADSTAVTTELASFAERVVTLRQRVEQINLGRSITERINIDNLDTNTSNFTALLTLAAQRGNDAALLAAITDCPRVQPPADNDTPVVNFDANGNAIPDADAGTVTVPVPQTRPAPTGTITSGAQIPVVAVTPPQTSSPTPTPVLTSGPTVVATR